MKLRRLCKANGSYPEENCPAVYVDDDQDSVLPDVVCQGKVLDPASTLQLRERAPDEVGGSMPAETLLRAAGLYLAERGHPSVLAEVETFLAEVQR